MQTDPHADAAELRRIDATLDWRGGFESIQHVRGHAFVVDEPAKLGGGDRGPTPLEYTLGAYDGCLQIMVVMIAGELGTTVRNLSIRSVATVDRRGLFGRAPVSPHYRHIETTIGFELDGSDTRDDAVEALKEKLYARCPMYNLLRDAGVELELHWHASSHGAR